MTKTFTTVKEMRNYIANNEQTNTNKPFAVVLMYKNFYAHKTVIEIIDTVDTYQQAQDLTKYLINEHKDILNQYKVKITFATTDLFIRGYSYKFAKQS